MRLPSASLLLYRLSEFPVIDEFIQRLIPSQCLINALTGEVDSTEVCKPCAIAILSLTFTAAGK